MLLAAFKMLSLALDSLTVICLSVDLFEFTLVGIYWTLWMGMLLFFLKFGEDYEAGGFHCDCRLLLFKATTELGVGQIGIGQVKSAQSSLFRHFNKHTLNCWKSLLISRVHKKLILFLPVFSLLLWRRQFSESLNKYFYWRHSEVAISGSYLYSGVLNMAFTGS